MPFKKGDAKPAGSGRSKGQRNKVTADIKALAQVHGETAIETLARLLKRSKFEATRIAAAKELLDRGYGKASQPIDGNVVLGISAELQELIEEHDGKTRSIPAHANGAVR